MHISRTVLTTIAIAATGSALPASSCGNGNCPHNGGGSSNSRVSSGDDQGAQQGQQGQQRFDKTRQNGDGGLSTRSHTLVFAAGNGAESGSQMGGSGSGSGSTGLYDKSDDYLGKKEFEHERLQYTTTQGAPEEHEQGVSGGSIIRYTKEQQQFQPRSEVSSGLRKTNDGQQQQQQQQGQESGQLMTTLDKIRELLFGSQQQQQQQQQQNLERQQQGKDNSHVRRSEVQGQQQQGSMGSGVSGNGGLFESSGDSQSGLERERQRFSSGAVEQPLVNNLNRDDGLTKGQNQRVRVDGGRDGQQSSNGQVQWSVVKGGDGQTMRGQVVPKIVISEHEQVQPRGQGQSSSKGSGSGSSSEGDSESVNFVQPAQMKTSMQQKVEKETSSSLGGSNQLLNKGENNNQGRLSGRAEHDANSHSTIPDVTGEKHDGSDESAEEEDEDQKAEKVLGSSDQGKQWGQTEDALKKCLYVAGQKGDISMLRDCFNNDAGKMQDPLQGQQGQQGQQQQRFYSSSTGQSQGQLQGGKVQA